MGTPSQSRTRADIRQAIGYNLGAVIVGEATSAGSTSTLTDNYNLARSGDDEFEGRQVLIIDPAGSIVAGEKSFVTSSANGTVSLVPSFSAATADGDDYEMWQTPFTVEKINSKVNEVISLATQGCLQDKVTAETFTEKDRYEYPIPTGFKAISKVEYVSEVGEEHVLEYCDAVWDELVDGDVTASIDTTIEQEGSACLKLVVAAGCAAGDILATQNITSVDLSDCDTVEIWVRASTALDAGDIQLLLDNTASCASPVETLNIPATAANTWTRHSLTLANPENDGAIISIGLKMAVDKGAFTLYTDYILAVDSKSRVYDILPYDKWGIVHGSTNYIRLTPGGLAEVGNARVLRLTSYQLPDLMTADTDTCDIDPEYVIMQATGMLMMTEGRMKENDQRAYIERAKYYLSMAAERKPSILTSYAAGTRWL